MKKTEKELIYPSEEEIRELFGDKISSNEKILWRGAAYSRRSGALFGLIASCAFEAIVFVFLVVEIYLGHSVLPAVFSGLFVSVFIFVSATECAAQRHPHYYAVTDEKVIICRWVSRKKMKFLSRDLCDCGSISARELEGNRFIQVFPKGASEDMPITFDRLSLEDFERLKELLGTLTKER